MSLKATFNIDRKFVIKGKEYSSIEEVPEELREELKNMLASGHSDLNAAMAEADRVFSSTGKMPSFPGFSMSTKITFNGKEYDSIESMPEVMRKAYGHILAAMANGRITPEKAAEVEKILISSLGKDASSMNAAGMQQGVDMSGMNMNMNEPIEVRTTLSPKVMIAIAAVIIIAALIYFRF